MLYFHSFKNPGFILDIVQDIRTLNELSRESRKAGMIVLGGGVCKHQIANAMLIVGAFFDLRLHIFDLFPAQRSRLLCIYRTSSIKGFHETADMPVEYRARIRRLRFWCTARRGRLLGQNPCGSRSCEGGETENAERHSLIVGFRSLRTPRWSSPCWWRQRLQRQTGKKSKPSRVKTSMHKTS